MHRALVGNFEQPRVLFYALARLMGHSSPRIAERYYIHVTESHVTAGFERFLEYQADRMIASFQTATDRVQ